MTHRNTAEHDERAKTLKSTTAVLFTALAVASMASDDSRPSDTQRAGIPPLPIKEVSRDEGILVRMGVSLIEPRDGVSLAAVL